MSRVLTLQAVLYAKDAGVLARFYAEVLALPRVEEGPGFVRLGAGALQLTVVQAPAVLADAIVVSRPPAVRESTPIKLSFAVADIEALRPRAEALGGGLQPSPSAWVWQGERHLDGWDPEGNVFQLRQAEGA